MMGEGGRFNVSLATPYYIGVFETTQQQYELVTGNNPSLHKGRLLPVDNVSWNEIRGDADVHDWPSVITVDPYSFIGLLQARSKLQIDLPTESQWEYACRAGTTTSYSYGEQSNGDYMWYYENSGLTTHDVGGRLANAWELYDMHGNVYEWCLERFVGSLSTGAEASSVDPSLRSHRMLRGGSWNSIVGWCYSYTWISLNPNSSGDYNDCGFRLAIHLAE
jgi:formylglycine-generating enzyme required for sulfatase activity